MYYYFKDGTKISSKLLSLEHEKIKKEECKFYYYDDFYSKLNWSFEPQHSLSYYYIEQAKKLREKYDYLILCYSGGIDSTNILETFYYNNIKLDKIVTVGAFSEDSSFGDDTNHNGEVYYNVFPYIQKLNLKDIFQVVDYTKHFYDIKKFSLYSNSNWIEETGSWFSPHHWIWRDFHNYVVPNEMKNKKVGIIFGRDKPLINKDINGYYFCFYDSILNSYAFYNGIDNIDTINFYWDPTFPEILLKQIHVIKKFLTLYNKNVIGTDSVRMTQVFQDEMSSRQIQKIDTHTLIYDLKEPLSFIGKKSQSKILSIRDSYLMKRKNSDVYDMFSKGIKQLNDRIKNLEFPNPNPHLKNELPGRISREYRI